MAKCRKAFYLHRTNIVYKTNCFPLLLGDYWDRYRRDLNWRKDKLCAIYHKIMDQHDYSGHYQSGHSSASHYDSASAQQQYSQSYTNAFTSSPGYDHASTGQITYQNDPYNSTDQYSEEQSNRPTKGQGRSLSYGPGPSTSSSSRRREQNRLAQRALRQRRESHVRELEHQVLHRSLETRHLAVENRELSHHLHSVTQENDLLRHQQVGNNQSAEAWLQGTTDCSAAPYAPYAQQLPSSSYDESAAFYSNSPYSSTSDPSPMRGPDWTWDDTLNPAHYNPSFAWTGNQSTHATGYGEQEEDEEEMEEELPQVWARRRG